MSSGLYGSSTSENLVRASLVELVGSFFLVFFGTGTAVSAALQKPIAGAPADSLMVVLTFGLTLMVMVCAFGHISGCHLNWAVTLSLVATKKFPLKYAPAYLFSQLAGSILASLMVWWLVGSDARSQAGLGAPRPAGGIGFWTVFGFEVIGAFLLVVVIVAVATDDRAPQAMAGIAIGFALAVAIAFAGPYTGGGINPSRSLGPMIVTGDFTMWWSYIFGPIVGGILGATFYTKIATKTVDPNEAEATS